MVANVFGIVILVALLVEHALNVVVGLLNTRALAPAPPVEFEDVVDADTYGRSQTYTRVQTRFGLVASSLRLLALLAFWFLGGFGALDAFVRGLGFGPTVEGLVFVGILSALSSALGLPFALYRTFVIEERFGFNRTTPRLFFVDRLKGLLLGVALGGPLLACVLLFFNHAGPFDWLYVWGLVAVFVVALQIIVPAWVMPLFNRFEPLEEGELRSALLDYARSVDFSLADVFVMDGSKRSGKSNAFFTGIGKRKRIALFDTLVEKHTTDELVGVVAHEVGHYKRGHILQGTVLGVLHAGVLLYLFSVVLSADGLFTAFSVDAPSVHVGLVLFGLLYAPVELLLSFGLNALSRRNERQADRFAADTTKRPEALASALRKLSLHNLSNLTPHPWHVALHYSHPPVVERLRNLVGRGGSDGSRENR